MLPSLLSDIMLHDHVRGLSAMSPRVKTSGKRFIAPRNMCVDGPRQPSFKGRDKPGAGVRPPGLEWKMAFAFILRGQSHTGAKFVSILERRLPGAAHTHVAWHYEAFSRGVDSWRHCGQPPDVKHDIA